MNNDDEDENEKPEISSFLDDIYEKVEKKLIHVIKLISDTFYDNNDNNYGDTSFRLYKIVDYYDWDYYKNEKYDKAENIQVFFEIQKVLFCRAKIVTFR